MTSQIPSLVFNNTEFKVCDPTQPNPTDCIMIQQIGSPNGVVRRTNTQQMLAQQSWPAAFTNGNLAAWHSPAFGYFNSTQQALCPEGTRVGVDNQCAGAGPILSAPYSRNAGPYNMANGQYLFQLTQPVPPLTGMTTSEILVHDRS